MKQSKFIFNATIGILMSCLVTTCQKEKNDASGTADEQEFTVGISVAQANSGLKSAPVYNLAQVSKVILTIKYNDGTATKYTSSEIKIQQMNGIYYTQKLVLKKGDYKLTEFNLIDSSGNTIFSAPVAGSQQAQNVTSPLPILFTVSKNITTPVDVEVLSTALHTPDDFGLSHFPIVEVKTFSFLIGVIDKVSGKFLTAKLVVSNDLYSYNQNLDSVANNVVTIKDESNNYTLTIRSNGYKKYLRTILKDSLNLFEDIAGNMALIIELEKSDIPANDLVAFYPFDGDVKDYSGSGNNGTLYGPVQTSDRFFYYNSSYEFDGGNDSVVVPHISLNNCSFTVCAWIYRYDCPSFDNDDAILGQQGSNGPDYNNKWLHCIIRNNYPYFGFFNNDLRSHNTLIDKNKWYFMTFVYDLENSKKKIYVNGALDSESSSGSYQGTAGLTLLGDYNNKALKGKLDDIRIYRRALTVDEIQRLYKDGN